jgi:hypothetical protein
MANPKSTIRAAFIFAALLLLMAGSAYASLTVISVRLNDGSLNYGFVAYVRPGATITTVVGGSWSSDSDWRGTGWSIGYAPGPMTCVDTYDFTSPADGVGSIGSFEITAPMAPGFYDSYFISNSADDCNGATSSPILRFPGSILVDNSPPTVAITYYDPMNPVQSGDEIRITATFSEAMLDAPVPKIAISGPNILPATDMFKLDDTTYAYVYTVGPNGGEHTVSISTGTDYAGNPVISTPTSGARFLVDNRPTADLTYSPTQVKAGEFFTITATFSKDMAATPAPQIAISGTNPMAATGMARIDATHYSLGVQMPNTGLQTVSLSVGTDLAGNLVNPTPTSGEQFTVENAADTTPPTAAITYSKNPVQPGESLAITATFSEAMADAPVPKIAISGANIVAATDMTKVSSTVYTYTYIVTSYGSGTATVTLSAGKDLAGNTVNPTPSNADFTVSIGPSYPSAGVTYSLNTIKSGDSLTITAEFNLDIAPNPVPQIAISGANSVDPTDMMRVSSRVYTYTYTVASGWGTAYVTLSAGTDLSGVAIFPTPTSGATFTIDHPVVITAPTASITYSKNPVQPGDLLTITALFSEDMALAPLPKIAIYGANSVVATEMARASPTTYVYSYIVGPGSGTAIVTLSAGTDLFGNVVNPTPTSGATFTVGSAAPTAAITYSKDPVKSGDSLTITATFSENMAIDPVPKIAINGPNTLAATAMTRINPTTYTYTYIVGPYSGTEIVSLSAGTGLAGILLNPTPTSGETFIVDNTVTPNPSFANTPFSCNQAQFDDILQICGIAALAMFALIALTYIGGEAMQSPRMLTWAKTEAVQAFSSLIIVSMLLFTMSMLCNFQVGELQGAFGLSSMPKIYVSAGNGIDTLYNGAMRYVENLAALGLSNVNSLRYDLAAYEIRTSFNTFECRGICVFSLASTSVSPFGGESMNLAVTNNLLGIGTISYLSSIFQYFTLIYIYSGLFTIFLPIALIMRSVPFMRHFGGSLIAIFVVLYIMYPLMLVADAYVVPGFTASSPSPMVMCDRDGRGCKGSDVFSSGAQGISCVSAGSAPCNGFTEMNMEVSTGALGSGINEASIGKISPNTITSAIQLNILIFLSSVFLPALNFIVIAAFGRELSRFLGEEADMSRLGQMI